MAANRYLIRDDDQYTVVVGWAEENETFFARVLNPALPGGQPVLDAGSAPGEIRTVSGLADAVQGFATVDAPTVSALRRDASPL